MVDTICVKEGDVWNEKWIIKKSVFQRHERFPQEVYS